ncbi:MAG: molecular chaperone DnaJ [Alphaproteobacteria bacterium]|nr:molecular chaperone DnaJ [Alphaproteobacteria bacterium]
MSNVIGMNEFVGMANGDSHCWLCQKPVSTRALFCHHCGTIQPVRDIDHFARLGLERRIDIDIELLERQYAALSRTLDPQRFLIRGVGERGHAVKQLEILNEAYETLRDPLRRGRYWLLVNEKTFKDEVAANPLANELREELNNASAASQCDRVAQRAGYALEQGIMNLMQALRGEDWQAANKTLAELDGVEGILDEVRGRRSSLTPDEEGRAPEGI